jgi:response regulator RpfG family c-di-GMP phosphodiesterase
MTSPNENGFTVLVVDDKRNMLSLMKKVLRDDARVLTAERGLDALKLLEAEPVDVVLCDLRMPDMDGVEVLKLCKRVRPQAEFILMTAYASVPTAVEALRLGAYDYLTKPFEPQAGRAVVLESGKRRQGGRGVARHAGSVTKDARARQPDQACRRERRDRAPARGNRNGQRARSSRHSSAQPPFVATVRRGELRGDPCRAPGERALRLHQRIVHGSKQGSAWAF